MNKMNNAYNAFIETLDFDAKRNKLFQGKFTNLYLYITY